jgi:hypothetical protein
MPSGQTYAPRCAVLDADNALCESDPAYCSPACTVADPTFWNGQEPTHDDQPDCVEAYVNDDNGVQSFAPNDAPCSNSYYPLCRYLAP